MTNMYFDPITRTSWKNAGIKTISIHIEKRGCAGEKIRIEEGRTEGYILIATIDETDIYSDPLHKEFLSSVTITGVNGKWIISSDMISTHCGCGSSFLRKSDNPLQDKIREIKLRMKEKKEGIHR